MRSILFSGGLQACQGDVLMEDACNLSAENVLADLFVRYPSLLTCRTGVLDAYGLLKGCFEGGGMLLSCGNGGSAADSEHVVGELMKSFRFKRTVDTAFADSYRRVNGERVPGWLEGALPAVSLVSQTALSTAFGNDEAAVGVFAQQVYGYGSAGDALLAISTSGNSVNVVEAAKVARAKGMAVIALTGARESRLSSLSDACVRVPETETFKVQELHLPVYHALCAAVEAELFGKEER